MKFNIKKQPSNPEAEVLYADGLEKALIGSGYQFNTPLAVYSKKKVLDILEKEMSAEEAIEFFEFNIQGAYVGPSTPVFLEDC